MNNNVRAILKSLLEGTKGMSQEIGDLVEEFKCMPENCEFRDSCREEFEEEMPMSIKEMLP